MEITETNNSSDLFARGVKQEEVEHAGCFEDPKSEKRQRNEQEKDRGER